MFDIFLIFFKKIKFVFKKKNTLAERAGAVQYAR
jgi:hypothetical protein